MTYKELDEFVDEFGFSPSECADREEVQKARHILEKFKRRN